MQYLRGAYIFQSSLTYRQFPGKVTRMVHNVFKNQTGQPQSVITYKTGILRSTVVGWRKHDP